MRRSDQSILGCLLLLLLLGACGSGSNEANQPVSAAQQPGTLQADPALEQSLTEILLAELDRLGKLPDRTVATPPAGEGNAVFHVLVDATPPDGLGAQGSASLMFYPRMVGDYDGNGEVGISDITPLGQFFGASVAYDDPLLHDGISYWPAGDPDGEGRENWIKARVDGDGNGEINVADITPIAIRFGEHTDGWRVEQRFSADDDYSFLPHPERDEAYSVGWRELAEGSIGYLLEVSWPSSGYLEMRTQAWDNASAAAGPMSLSGLYEHPAGDCLAFLQADPVVADFPFTTTFTAAGTSVLADSYLLDFGDGSSQPVASLAEFPLEHSYTESGIYDVVFTVSCEGDQAIDTFQIMATPLPCELQVQLGVMPDNGFAPLNVLFDATGTSSGAVSYILDFGDGSTAFESANLAELAVQHEYTETGEYTAVLTASCAGGGSVQSDVLISVGNLSDECSVNLSVTDNTLLIGTATEFFFSGTTGTAALLDLGDGSDIVFVNLQGPEPILYEYAAVGTYLAELSIICNDSKHSDSVLVFVQPEPVVSFDVSGGVYQYESNPPIGGPEPDKFPMENAEIEIYSIVDDLVLATTTTDAEGQYFFAGESIGLDVTKVYMVRPTDAERTKHLPLDWFPGVATIALPEPEVVKVCTDINLLASAT